ncbi:GH18690 [Drosophila grimshawi]|nr:GH18690 [Drosophila grimshawi]
MQLRGDYSSTSAVNSAAKTIVTITAPPAAAASVSSLHLGAGRPSSVSTLTLASVPPSLLLEASMSGLKGGSVSAANTPIAPAMKHISFAMGPGTSTASCSGSGHHVSFMPMPLPMMGVKRFRESSTSLSSPTAVTTVATSSAPSLIEAEAKSSTSGHHAALELRQSVQSQITTLEDVDDVEHSDENSSDSESVGLALVQTTPQLEYQVGMASSSSSASVK